MFFSFKTVDNYSNPPTFYRPKQIRAGEYAVGRKIGLERVISYTVEDKQMKICV
jgi:hypothetical protein